MVPNRTLSASSIICICLILRRPTIFITGKLVDHIEIVEGSMGVTYGANAVSGVLNIITKKSSKYKWGITASVQEETVSDEYSLFKEGRHVQALKVSHTFNKNWYFSLGANRNDFQGYLSDKNGIDYSENEKLSQYLKNI